APPVADAGQVGQDGAVRAESFGARGGDAADAIGPHQDELGPTGRGSPGEEHAQDEQGHGGTALAEDEGRHQEEALVAPAHGQGGRAQPANGARVGPWREAGHACVLSSVRYTGAHHVCISARLRRLTLSWSSLLRCTRYCTSRDGLAAIAQRSWSIKGSSTMRP